MNERFYPKESKDCKPKMSRIAVRLVPAVNAVVLCQPRNIVGQPRNIVGQPRNIVGLARCTESLKRRFLQWLKTFAGASETVAIPGKAFRSWSPSWSRSYHPQ